MFARRVFCRVLLCSLSGCHVLLRSIVFYLCLRVSLYGRPSLDGYGDKGES